MRCLDGKGVKKCVVLQSKISKKYVCDTYVIIIIIISALLLI
jgi:hypothetical protein